jgi:hypothetical protein
MNSIKPLRKVAAKHRRNAGIKAEGVDWPNSRICSFPGFFPTFQHVNHSIHVKKHFYQEMVKTGCPQITPLSSDHLKQPNSSFQGPFFRSKTGH